MSKKKKSSKARAQQKRRQKRAAKTKARTKAIQQARVRAKERSGLVTSDEPASAVDGLRLPDRRALEGSLAAFSGGGRDGGPVAHAQELMYQAFNAPTTREAVQLAREAIAISPDCADAYTLLAERTARSQQEAADLYREAVAAGERALGPQAFEDDVGHFWGLLETRPYMRARQGLAECLWHLGERTEAVNHYRELLRLNPNDNQGVRYGLAAWLLALGEEAELEALLEQYEEDVFAGWTYTRALLAFRREGDTEESRALLSVAVEGNPHVPAFVSGRKRLPKHLPDYMGLGDENEAIAFCVDYADSWRSTPGALRWLEENGRAGEGS